MGPTRRSRDGNNYLLAPPEDQVKYESYVSQNLASGWWGWEALSFPRLIRKEAPFLNVPCVFGHCHLGGAEDVKAILDGLGPKVPDWQNSSLAKKCLEVFVL